MIYLLLNWKHSNCLYLDFYEFLFLKGIFDLKPLTFYLFAFEFLLFLYFYSKYQNLLIYFKKKSERLMEEDWLILIKKIV